MRTISDIAEREPLTERLVNHEFSTHDEYVLAGPERVYRFASSYAYERLLDLEPTNAPDYE